MANYCCAVRTNYFRVKDAEAFKKFMEGVYNAESGTISVWEKKCEDNTLFAFGCFGSICGIKESDEYDDFIDGLQKYVAEDDAIIIWESGNEKLCYLTGTAEIITTGSYECIDIRSLAISKAAELLKNPDWETDDAY